MESENLIVFMQVSCGGAVYDHRVSVIEFRVYRPLVLTFGKRVNLLRCDHFHVAFARQQ